MSAKTWLHGANLSEWLPEKDWDTIKSQTSHAMATGIKVSVLGYIVVMLLKPLVGVAMFMINSYQAGWILKEFASVGGADQLVQWACYMIGACLIVSTNILLLSCLGASAKHRLTVKLLLIGLVTMSIMTSGLQLTYAIQSGVVRDIETSSRVTEARIELDRARHQLDTFINTMSAKGADSLGWALREGQDSSFKQAVSDAQIRYDTAKSDNSVSAISNLIASATRMTNSGIAGVSAVFGWVFGENWAFEYKIAVEDYALIFSWAIVALLEWTRIALTQATLKDLQLVMSRNKETMTQRKAVTAHSQRPQPTPPQPPKGTKKPHKKPKSTLKQPINAVKHEKTASNVVPIGLSAKAAAKVAVPSVESTGESIDELAAKLNRAIKALRSGAMPTAGINQIQKHAAKNRKCGDKSAKWVQAQLINRGYVAKKGRSWVLVEARVA